MTTLQLFLEHRVVIFSSSHFLHRQKSLTKGSGGKKACRVQPSNFSRRQAFVCAIKSSGKMEEKEQEEEER